MCMALKIELFPFPDLKTWCVPLFPYIPGSAYPRAEHEIHRLVTSHYLPFLPTPMGKGVITDDHPLSVAAARSK